MYKKILLCLVCCSLQVSCSNKKTKDGRECWKCQRFKIFQGLEYGGLARECSLYDEYNDTCYRNMIVYLVAPSGADFYNNQKVLNNSNACWVQDGVYRYVTKNNIPAAVPLLELAEIE